MNNFSKIESKILNFWNKNKIFEKSIKQRKNAPIFSFYDGPPFATGKPHYGHILATAIKDSVLRYWTMRGYRAPRRVGWDCHGLPIENLIEKELGVKNRKEIESMGIKNFNKACKKAVFRTVDDFERILKRVGRWADYKNSYATLDNNYIESVWWIFSRLWKQGLVYKDYRVSPYCPRCETPISNLEVNLGYKDVKNRSIFVKFKIKSEKLKDSFLLAWTTTPWTLPGNVALAIDPKAKYIQVQVGDESIIVIENMLELFKGEHRIVKKIDGKDLVGTEYIPLFSSLDGVNGYDKAFKVFPGSFVSTDEGTGIVHSATMYGIDDFELGKKFGLPATHTVDGSGNFTERVKEWSGRFVKDCEDDIIKNLRERGLLYMEKTQEHSYPFCWRCDTPILYYALKTWYIDVVKIKKQLISNNKKINWVPSHIKDGRFGKWLKGVKDWSFSRNRFWGAPIPIWKCKKCGEYRCIESTKELPKKIDDLHRPYIDKIKFDCSCGGKMTRIEEVFDCWFESGSMPYASWHYPFENKKLAEESFPADFIAEGLDQTRGWFYTLHVLASALTIKDIGLGKEEPAFKNVIVNGMILAADGRKLSKSLKNYPDVNEIFDTYGADSLRYFLLSSTSIGEDYLFSSKGVEDIWRKVISTFWNSYVFFNTHRDKKFTSDKNFVPSDDLDKWIISRTNSVSLEITKWMEKYELTKAARPLEGLIDDLSNWFIRRSRRRLQRPKSIEEKEETSQTLYLILSDISKMMAPFMPFISEHMYQELSKMEKGKIPESVHLCDYPIADSKKINRSLEKKMEAIRGIVKLALSERSKAGIKVRQPLALLTIKETGLKSRDPLISLIKDEVNVKKVIIDNKIEKDIILDIKLNRELEEEGFIREIIRQVQTSRKSANLSKKDKITIIISGPKAVEEVVLKWEEVLISETLAFGIRFSKKIEKGSEIKFDDEILNIWIEKMKSIRR